MAGPIVTIGIQNIKNIKFNFNKLVNSRLNVSIISGNPWFLGAFLSIPAPAFA